jgi:hypothetical protein
MYLPMTVTMPLMLGGIVYKMVETRSKRKRLSPEASQAAIHRGFLFASGLVAGEAIMGIVIAGLVVAKLNMPLVPTWAPNGVMLLVSLGGLAFMTWALHRKSVGSSGKG